MKKQLPIGVSNFKEIIENGYYYIDKSLLVKDIVERGKVVLITRPRRFGKTLNLSMLRYFFEIDSVSTSHLFEELEISKFEKYREMQGQFPVIFVSFKDIFQPTYALMIEDFTTTIAEEFDKHAYLLESSALTDYEKNEFTNFRTKAAPKHELINSLRFLITMLYKHYNKKVVLLIDEYDTPVQVGFVHGFYDEITTFMKGLLTKALKDQERLHKGVLTGIMSTAKAGIFSGLNNLDIYSLTNPHLADKFGFTEEEVLQLLHYYGIANHETIKEWYDGYRFGNTPDIYNPWSILNCAQNDGALTTYWANTSDNILLTRLIAQASTTTKSELELLLTGKMVEKTIHESIIYPQIDRYPDLIWSVLLFTGYLTYTDRTINAAPLVCNLTIPNKEIYLLYGDLIRTLFTESIMGGQAEALLKALTEGDTEIFEDLLQSFILNSMSMYDIASKEPEKSYHLFVLGLLVMLSDTYEVTSNKESAHGRYDILITPRDKTKSALVIEFKKVSGKTSAASLNKFARKALDQIIEKKYAQHLYSLGYERIIAYGIAFERKQVAVQSCTLAKPETTC